MEKEKGVPPFRGMVKFGTSRVIFKQNQRVKVFENGGGEYLWNNSQYLEYITYALHYLRKERRYGSIHWFKILMLLEEF